MKPLSTNNIINTLGFPVVLFFVSLFFLAGSFSVPSQDLPPLLNPVVILLFDVLLIVLVFRTARDTYDLHYDDEFVYLYGITRRIKMPFSSIKKIAKTTDGVRVKGLTSWKYVITFDASSGLKEQSIYEIIGTSKVAAFIDTVKKVNPSVLSA